jgi:hypothetical protein
MHLTPSRPVLVGPPGGPGYPLKVVEVAPHATRVIVQAPLKHEDYAGAVVAHTVLLHAGHELQIALVADANHIASFVSSELVVVVERPVTDPQWNRDEADATRASLLRGLGPTNVEIDLSVRSGEQFEEARAVVGGVERLVDAEGVVLYACPFRTEPTPVRTKEQVRRNLVRTWVAASARFIDRALAAGQEARAAARECPSRFDQAVSQSEGGTLRITLRPTAQARSAGYYWNRALQQAIAAVCVHHQIASAKHEATSEVIARIGLVDIGAASRLRRVIAVGSSDRVALAALEEAVSLIPKSERRSPAVVPVLTRLRYWKDSLGAGSLRPPRPGSL